HAGLQGHPGPSIGGVGRGLLVAKVDDSNALGHAPVVDGSDVPAREGEEVGNAFLLDDLGHQVPAVPGCIHALMSPAAGSVRVVKRPGSGTRKAAIGLSAPGRYAWAHAVVATSKRRPNTAKLGATRRPSRV